MALPPFPNRWAGADRLYDKGGGKASEMRLPPCFFHEVCKPRRLL